MKNYNISLSNKSETHLYLFSFRGLYSKHYKIKLKKKSLLARVDFYV